MSSCRDVPIYVVQVIGGREERACAAIARMMGSYAQDCYTPEYILEEKHNGVWKKVRKRLFPGYVFVQTEYPRRLFESLKSKGDFARMLGVKEDSFAHLTSEEALWLDALTDSGNHVAGMSTGFIEGEHVVVTEGPLKGCEANIVKINRHKRTAFLEISILGRNAKVKVGLEIVRKQPVAAGIGE